MNNILKKIIYILIILTICNSHLFAENNNIDYYGIVSEELDDNMAKMTSDLYYTQLSELDNFSIIDKRTTPCRKTIPDISSIQTDNFIFYSEITKLAEDNWTVIFTLCNKENNKTISKSKSYNSFYKILIESKNELKTTIKELLREQKKTCNKQTPDTPMLPQTKSENKITITSLESLSGTWKGEESIDKIVILRGGRGFVIFTNGASMNISVNLEDINNEQFIIIKQKSNSNASFYPELPRQIALEAAVTAPPIKWTMSMLENMVMTGYKNTLILENGDYVIGTIPVTWIKTN